MTAKILELESLQKSYPLGSSLTPVVDHITLEIRPNEFFTLLGPSGCGKTTLLRLIAGLESPDGGRIRLDGIDITTHSPNKRHVNTVFQSYALFPHMSVEANVGFGLRMQKKHTAKEIASLVKESLETVQLTHLAQSKPHQLSGGQQQRVALARALINKPKILLLDESLSALDFKLRKEMQIELKSIQRKTGITFIFVTHDQDEALSMSDRIAVLNKGKIEQLGTPEEVYQRPATRFVANFVGICNFVKGETFHIKEKEIGFRPEELFIDKAIENKTYNDPAFAFGVIKDIGYHGPVTHYLVNLDSGETVLSARQKQVGYEIGDRVYLRIAPERTIQCQN